MISEWCMRGWENDAGRIEMSDNNNALISESVRDVIAQNFPVFSLTELRITVKHLLASHAAADRLLAELREQLAAKDAEIAEWSKLGAESPHAMGLVLELGINRYKELEQEIERLRAALANLRKQVASIGVGASEGYALACMDIGVLFDEALAATSLADQMKGNYNMTQEAKDEHVEALVRWSVACLKAFRSGYAPTFEQLDRLQSALYPFTNDKLCGHRITEDCDCAELNGIFLSLDDFAPTPPAQEEK